MLWENWDGRDDFFELWQGNFDSIAGSNPQGKAEAKIVNTISFFFGRNQEIIKYFMDILPFDTHFSKYPSHRKQLLEWSQNVTWCYCEGVSFMTKHHVATGIYFDEASTVEEITQHTNTGQKQVERALNILEAEGVIQTVNESKNRRVVTECNITEGYIDELEEITYKYEEVKQKESSNPNIRRVTI
jgi:hypothetical protein